MSPEFALSPLSLVLLPVWISVTAHSGRPTISGLRFHDRSWFFPFFVFLKFAHRSCADDALSLSGAEDRSISGGMQGIGAFISEKASLPEVSCGQAARVPFALPTFPVKPGIESKTADC